MIGVHTPEFAFEASPENVAKALKDLEISYPVALDNQKVIWQAYQNHYWPAHYLIDRRGNLRSHHYGKGQTEETEQMIRSLLQEISAPGQPLLPPPSTPRCPCA